MSPHRIHAPYSGIVLDSALDAISNTPLIRLDRVAKLNGLKCNLYGKVEYFNVGGSVKDRVAKRMIEQAEKEGKLIPGKSVLVEPTSGNTGIAIALVAALKGYPVIITLPERMSLEKEITLRALGAEIVRTPDNAPFYSEHSHLGVARRLVEAIPGAIMLDQFENPENTIAHELTTAPEIIEAIESTLGGDRPTSGKVDVFVAGAGTAGTITGVSRAIRKNHNPNLKVIGCDPKGSIIAEPASLNDPSDGPFIVEGIGSGFVPPLLHRPCVCQWIKTSDQDAWAATRMLHRHEALLVGGSSGSLLAGALKYLKSEQGWIEHGGVEGANVVVLLPDGIRNYMSKAWFIESFAVDGPHCLASQISDVLKDTKAASSEDSTSSSNSVAADPTDTPPTSDDELTPVTPPLTKTELPVAKEDTATMPNEDRPMSNPRRKRNLSVDMRRFSARFIQVFTKQS